MNLTELEQIVGQQIEQATGAFGTRISDLRTELLKRYKAEPYGDEEENRSSIVTTDVADTVEWLLPQLIEVFAGGEQTVKFEPVGQEDEEAAAQETDVVNHVFQSENQGFLVLYSWFKDALRAKNGYVKAWWEETETTEEEEYEGLSLEQALKIKQRWEKSGTVEDFKLEEDLDDETGEPLFEISGKVTAKTERVRIMPVPAEEVLVSPRHNSVSLGRAAFTAHRRIATASELIEQGFNARQVRELGSTADDASEFGQERRERFAETEEMDVAGRQWAGDAMKPITVTEAYIRVDYDGDGVAELRKVVVAGPGNELLKWQDGKPCNDPIDFPPLFALSPILEPHAHYGTSVAELVTDLQRIRSVLFRQFMDNLYRSNFPMMELPEAAIGDNTIEDLLNPRPSSIVRTAQPGMMREIVPPPLGNNILPALEMLASERENRTGVTRYNQGLDAESLNKTARGIDRIMNAAQQKIQLIARIFAETGVRDLFLAIHHMLSKHSTRSKAIRLRGKWVEVDPQEWGRRSDMTVQVGLGSGNKDQMLGHLLQVLGIQSQALAAGSPLVTWRNVYNTGADIVRNAGLKAPERYFTEPAEDAQAPGAAQAGAAQAVAQTEQAKMQLEMAKIELERERLALEWWKARQQDDRERDKAEGELIIKSQEVGIKTAQANAGLWQAEIQPRIDAEREERGAQRSSQDAAMSHERAMEMERFRAEQAKQQGQPA